MPPISEVVNVTITRETRAVTQQGFGTLLFVGESGKLPEVDTVTITLSADLITGNVLGLYLNGVALSDASLTYATSHAATMAAIEAYLETLDEIDTVTVGGTGNRTLTIVGASGESLLFTNVAVTGGASQPTVTVSREAATRIRFYTSLSTILDDFAATDDEYLAAAAYFAANPSPVRIAIGAKRSGDATWAAALGAIQQESNDWYGLAISSRTKADVKAVALVVESDMKIFGTASADANILSAGSTTDVAAELQALGYDRTFSAYHPEADGDAGDPWPECAWFGKMLPYIPGSATWAFKALAGVAVTTLSTTQSAAARDKNCNTYETIGGVNVTREGQMASGEYIDIMIGIDWMTARMQEQIFARIANLPKVPFTDPGIAVVEAEIRSVLNQGIGNNLIAADPAYTITVPKASAISSNDKANRQLTGLSFLAYLSGAVHYAAIAGVVTL